MKKFIYALLKDLVDQAWTFLGLAIGWVLLEGSARDLVGNLILITLGIWVVTFPTRYDKGDDNK